MKKLKIFYATNRKHEGSKQWPPDRYGNKFSDSGIENLRFDKPTIKASANIPDKKYKIENNKTLIINTKEILPIKRFYSYIQDEISFYKK